MDDATLYRQAAAAHRAGNLAEAERGYSLLLVRDPALVRYPLGLLRAQQGRSVEAAALMAAALAQGPVSGEMLLNYGNVLLSLGRFTEALPVLDQAGTLLPDNALLWTNRGHLLLKLDRAHEALGSFERALALQPDNVSLVLLYGDLLKRLNRPQDALVHYDRAMALAPGNVVLLNNRSNALRELNRLEEALAGYDRALAIDPHDAMTHNNRGNALKSLGRHDAAVAALDRALQLQPDHPSTLYNRGKALCHAQRIADGFADFTRSALLTNGVPAWADENAAIKPQRARHDAEQAVYLREIGSSAAPERLSLEGGARLDGPAINPANAAQAQAAWQTASPQLVVVDDLLTPEALAALRRFCWGSTVWRSTYDGGYLGAFPEHGFAAPLLAQIADEFRTTFAGIVGRHALNYIWAFKYDSTLNGIAVHADRAAINVNFWITPDEANLDPDHGGLVVWDVAAPLDWDFEQYNGDIAATRAFLARSGAKPVTVPYRANRAVIFDSDLFHQTDTIRFKEGYRNRRINVTLLYGDRA